MISTSLVLAFVAAAVPAAHARTAERPVAAQPVRCLIAPRERCRRFAAGPGAITASVPMVAADLTRPSPAVVPPTEEQPTPAAPPARLGVVAREWSLVLSRTSLPAGPALIELQNQGEDAHNLRIERVDGSADVDVPEAEAGEISSREATLASGDYRLYCALPGHEAAGMRASLSVR